MQRVSDGDSLQKRKRHANSRFSVLQSLFRFVTVLKSGSQKARPFFVILQPSGTQEEVEQKQAATVAADLLEGRFAANIDFGGISTSQVRIFQARQSLPERNFGIAA